eukprot:4524889-Amphidinium_carterae.2
MGGSQFLKDDDLPISLQRLQHLLGLLGVDEVPEVLNNIKTQRLQVAVLKSLSKAVTALCLQKDRYTHVATLNMDSALAVPTRCARNIWSRQKRLVAARDCEVQC